MKKTFLALGLFISGGASVFAGYSLFPDVNSDDWFYEGVKYSSDQGLMTGYENKKFGPNDPVSRAQLATILERMETLNADNIEKMRTELQAIRLDDVNNLFGSPWQEYVKRFWRFPVEGIQIPGEGYVPYDNVKDDLKVVAIDEKSTIKVLTDESVGSEKSAFYLETEGMGAGTFGPFYDNLERIVDEIEASNAK